MLTVPPENDPLTLEPISLTAVSPPTMLVVPPLKLPAADEFVIEPKLSPTTPPTQGAVAAADAAGDGNIQNRPMVCGGQRTNCSAGRVDSHIGQIQIADGAGAVDVPDGREQAD